MGRKKYNSFGWFCCIRFNYCNLFPSPNQQSSNLTDNINASRDLSSNISFSNGVSANLKAIIF